MGNGGMTVAYEPGDLVTYYDEGGKAHVGPVLEVVNGSVLVDTADMGLIRCDVSEITVGEQASKRYPYRKASKSKWRSQRDGVQMTASSRWRVQFWWHGKNRYVGTYDTEEEARDCRAEARKALVS